jgi:hypothetical protein
MDPNAADKDVKKDQAPSPDQGVKAESPTAIDVPSASSAEQTPPPEKPHEENVPYTRFSEVLEKNKELEARLAEMTQAGKPPESATPEPEAQPQIDWSALGFTPPEPKPPDQQPQQNLQQVPALTPEEIEQRLRDDMYNKPYATLAPIIIELAKQVNRSERQAEARVRAMPGFRDIESSFYSIPDDVIVQAQSNPEVIRYLLAMNARSSGRSLASAANPPQTLASQAAQNAQHIPSSQESTTPPQTMEELKKQYLEEGKRQALEEIRNQKGMASEGSGFAPPASGDDLELGEYEKGFMRKLGLGEDRDSRIAKRLQSFSGGKE